MLLTRSAWAGWGRSTEPMALQSDDRRTKTSLEENLKKASTWLRLLFMILFLVLWGISRVVVLAVVVLQFFWALIGGKTNSRLAGLGQGLATYSYQIVISDVQYRGATVSVL